MGEEENALEGRGAVFLLVRPHRAHEYSQLSGASVRDVQAPTGSIFSRRLVRCGRDKPPDFGYVGELLDDLALLRLLADGPFLQVWSFLPPAATVGSHLKHGNPRRPHVRKRGRVQTLFRPHRLFEDFGRAPGNRELCPRARDRVRVVLAQLARHAEVRQLGHNRAVFHR